MKTDHIARSTGVYVPACHSTVLESLEKENPKNCGP